MDDKTYKLTRLEIRGYKSISNDCPLFLDIRDINVFIGANGSGKSNIVSFFKMVSYMMSGALQLYVEQSGTNQTFLHYGPKKTPALSAVLRFENSTCFDTYRFSLAHASLDRLIINSEQLEWGRKDRKKSPKIVSLESNYKESALIEAGDLTSKIVRRILGGIKVYQFHDTSILGPLRQSSIADGAHYLQAEANNLASFLLYLKDNYNAEYLRIVDNVRMVVPQFNDFYLQPERGYVSLKWVDTSLNDYVFSANQLSDGSIRFIALAVLLLQPKPTMPDIIVIDEPELGLHPFAVDRLSEMIKDASLHAQVIVATQSSALIDLFDVEDVAVVEYDKEKMCTQVSRLDKEAQSVWLEEYSLSELWNKNVIGGRPL